MSRPKRILLAFHWYLESLHQGALRVCLERGWDALPLTLDTLPMLRDEPVDGVVCMLPGDAEHPVFKFVAGLDVPVVELSLAHPERRAWGRCPEDCETISREAAAFLAKLPVKSFAFVSNGTWWNHDARAAAFKAALAGDPRPFREFRFSDMGGHLLAERPLGEALSKLPGPVGIFGSVDSAAKIAVSALTAQGFEVPGDAYVLGFGNRELESLWTAVPISTVDIDYEAWAVAAARLLAGMIDGAVKPGTVVQFPPDGIVERRSTGLSPEKEKLCARAIALIESSLASPLAVSALAKACGVSKATLERAFDREFGCGVARKSLLIRIEHAKGMLAKGVKTEATAVSCGFKSYSAFISAFRRISGVTPGDYSED